MRAPGRRCPWRPGRTDWKNVPESLCWATQRRDHQARLLRRTVPKMLRVTHRPLRTRTATHRPLSCDRRLCSACGRGGAMASPAHCGDGGREKAPPRCACGRLCPGAVSALSCGCPVSPSPGKCVVAQDPHSSESASVIYGFVLLLGTPTLVCVLPTPGCLRGPAPTLSTRLEAPSVLCSSGRFPCAALSQGSPRSSPSCPQSRRRG